MIEHVRKVLADPKRVYPDYDAAQGFELAGFVWLQGFNDMVDGHVYPNHNKPNRFDLYSELLAHFIRDVRKDLAAPNLPFVIGVMGVGGLKDESVDMLAFRRAMAAPAAMPEFKGNVVAVQTAPFWSEELGAIDKKHEKVRQMRYFLDSKHKDHANADRQDDRGAKAGVCEEVRGRSHHARRSRALETRRLQRRLPLPRLREDLRADGQEPSPRPRSP